MIAMRPPHKFFEKFLDNDLDDLYNYLENKQQEMLEDNIFNIPESELSKYNKYNGPTTQLGMYYNIFDFDHDGIKKLKEALAEATKEASEYYGIVYEEQKYKIHGWYNLDPKTEGGGGVSPLKNNIFYHDHMGGEGAPIFHGYYCVNAEPSITYYLINGETQFENINKNNRAIVSETGHPHGRDDWYQDKPRITIAYDIAPSISDAPSDIWCYL